MALFRRFPTSTFGTRDSDFRSLFRLMDDLSSSIYNDGSDTTTSVRGAFSPRFDIEEKDNAYHLHGELPGIEQKNIEIEFTDAHTLVIKGDAESHLERSNDDESGGGRRPKAIETTQADNTAGTRTTAVAAQNHNDNNNKQLTQPATTPSRWWISERSRGEFYRSFSFPSRVDQDGVQAKLSKGILSIVVPKLAPKKPAAKKVSIETED